MTQGIREILQTSQGQHIGELPTCNRLRASIRQRNAEGYPTICADTYAWLVQGADLPAESDDACDLV